MKLYTEEQVRKAIIYARSISADNYENPPIQRVLNSITPIELPSDEEIDKQSKKWVLGSQVWEKGAKWMKEQILNQNRIRVFGESDDKQFWSDKPNQNK